MKKVTKLALVLGLAFSLAACGSPAKDGNNKTNQGQAMAENNKTEVDNKENPEETAPDTNPQGVLAKEDYVDEKGYPISPAQAMDVFAKQYPGVKLTELSFDKEDGRYVYDLEGQGQGKEASLRLDATSGEVLKQEEDKEKDKEVRELDKDGIKTEKEAFEAAKKAQDKAVKGIEEWSLEVEDGKTVYTVKLDLGTDDLEVKLDAKTLEVLDLDD